ncbi:MAG: OB-fold domain-containing protein [Acidimicrobiia bacterium]|nr:OB-fold domain-containing protein [Acidimicrobiia bacterium]MDH5237565.1 OB-fold domain-containing protein [Acidimicrobiia bacterium]
MSDPSVPPAALARSVSLPPSLAGFEPVQSVRTPIRLEYDYIPGTTSVTYLTGYADKKILGQKSPVDGAVFVPPRGIDPRHGVPCTEFVELPDRGHVGSFCVTRLPIPGRDDLEVPYVSAWIFLDGADIGFIGLVAGVPTGEVEIGTRVKAVWKPDDQLGRTAENILYWKPTGEDPLPLEQSGTRGFSYRQAQKEASS